jgi:hypothetical protein
LDDRELFLEEELEAELEAEIQAIVVKKTQTPQRSLKVCANFIFEDNELTPHPRPSLIDLQTNRLRKSDTGYSSKCVISKSTFIIVVASIWVAFGAMITIQDCVLLSTLS